jgi:hypothetical protein
VPCTGQFGGEDRPDVGGPPVGDRMVVARARHQSLATRPTCPGSHAAEGTGADRPGPRVSDWLDLTSGACQPASCGRTRGRDASCARMAVFGPIAQFRFPFFILFQIPFYIFKL